MFFTPLLSLVSVDKIQYAVTAVPDDKNPTPFMCGYFCNDCEKFKWVNDWRNLGMLSLFMMPLTYISAVCFHAWFKGSQSYITFLIYFSG